MKRKKNLLSLMLCVSLALHGVLFFLMPVYPVNNFRLPNPVHSPGPFALVNIALIEPAVPEAPPPRPLPALSEELPADIGPADLGPADIGPADIGPAENFIPVEEFIPANTDRSPSADAPAALTAAYVKRDYNYIQSRIREKLVYPSLARRAGLQGSAEISFIIHEDGRISNVLVISSSGSESLDTAAVEAIYAASPFRPPPAEARLAIPVTFRLR